MKDNCITSTKKLLDLLEVKHTEHFLEDSILSHPDHPSFLCVSDALKRYNIENIAVKVEKEKLAELPCPCIVQLKGKGTLWFCVLKNIVNNNAIYYDEDLKIKNLNIEQFKEIWTGISLLVEKNEKSGEPGINERKKEKRVSNSLYFLFGISLITWLSWQLSGWFSSLPATGFWLFFAYFIIKVLGFLTSVGLLWYEVDQYNPVIQSFCSGGKKVNCEAVLQSKYAKFLNGKLSLSILAFAYFFSTATGLLVFGLHPLLLVASLVTLPIVAISIYYQALVLKNWCKFCLIVASVLLGENAIAAMTVIKFPFLSFEVLTTLAFLFLLCISCWFLLKPYLIKDKESLTYKRSLAKIKNNPVVFESLLSKSRKVENYPEGLGLNFVNQQPKCKVIKVCNPYCGPCADAHPVLDKLYKIGLIDLQIIFTATPDEKDIRSLPVAHFLAIEEQLDGEKTLESLDKWYGAKKKDYEAFAGKFPMNGELKSQSSKIAAMDNWCKVEKIAYTPTVFVNGFELPKEYRVDDLEDLLAN